ncbi:MAG TPA: class I SAM-dependent methyltransferase [Thermoanaerobaculia bacterium]|nr:class I SAM-dependent methyltransferase [Thermoanaerobaculia bacterium]
MPLTFSNDDHHPLLDTLLRTRVPRWEALNRAVDERDDMLDFAMKLFHGDRDAALVNYFQNGLEQFELVKHIASWRGPMRRMLDFASGYGRLTRFLVHQQLADEITVSDILEGGMEFQAREFGVRTILSATAPTDFLPGSRATGQPGSPGYDLIFVASLFTHLPPATFTPWLRRLVELLEPRGLLVFSVHDESIAPENVGEGINFAAHSESRVLDTSEYGSTWVTESYVREQVAAIGAGLACVRLPRALAEWQDVYVVSPSPIENARPRRAPKGFIEHCDTAADGILLTGWATVADEAPDRVEVRIDDEIVATARAFHPRDDVAKAFGPGARDSGWDCLVPHSAVRSFRYQTATVSIVSSVGVERILFLGTIDAATGFVARERARARDNQIVARDAENAELRERIAILEHQRAELERTIAAMRNSRFWRARERWFALKRGLRITNEQ